MSSGSDGQEEKPLEATPQKLLKAREKGEVARSRDLSVAAGYLGLLAVLFVAGPATVLAFGDALASLLDNADGFAAASIAIDPDPRLRGLIMRSMAVASPWFLVPSATVLLSIMAQRSFLITPSKLAPRLSRISLVSNAKQKFGRTGLFEFAKSFSKLVLYSVCLALFLRRHIPDLIGATGEDPAVAIILLARLGLEFLALATLVSLLIGAIDVVWQHFEHRRKNRMSRQEMLDETKDAEGDPHLKHKRRQIGRDIASNRMLADVPDANVVIVNPQHFAVALSWERRPGTAPVCVAKGQDHVARVIKDIAREAGVPIHADPPTARAIYATVTIGREVEREHYRAVAAAIRFADDMRRRARGQV